MLFRSRHRRAQRHLFAEPERIGEEMTLSAPVAAAVDEAVGMILGLVAREEPAGAAPEQPREEASL